MSITASQISVSQDPTNPDGTICTFIRSDTSAIVTIPVEVVWNNNATTELAEVKTAIQTWETEQNSYAAANAAAVGVTV